MDGSTVFEWDVDADGASDVANTVLFAGYRFDAETGLYHVRNRMYHATLGRWVQRDPAGYVDGMGLYEYARAQPSSHSDPWGLRTIKIRFLMHGEKPKAWPNNERLESDLQKILDTCFKCCEDKVVAEVVQIEKRANAEEDLGLFPRPTPGSGCQGPTKHPPTKWNQEVHFRSQSAAGEVAYTKGARTSVAGPEFDKDIARNKVTGKHKGYGAANVVAHEGLYVGMLDESDKPGFLGSLLGETPSDYPEIYTRKAPADHLVEIPQAMCDRLKRKLDVKCCEPGDAE
ncbi:MAG: RHS repeat-associated core domain-containing protein [Phycisphaerae bacterium]